ncbi:MAG TPA: methionyl-tRNA formyltransferase [Rhodocyclaceae bacterium]|nr:methionyl-tRNA formyltransferase [Rhodocyclaceae bacterium]
MKLIFAGTPEFAAQALEALIAAGHEIALVLTQPDRPAGRGMQLQASAVKQVALKHGIPVYQPEKLRDPATHAPIREAAADCMVVAAYGIILPQTVLDLPRIGCLNIHASLLPRWRGAAPIQRAIEAGDSETGITIMQMDAGLDTGPIVAARAIAIDARDTAGTLHDRLATLGAGMIVETLERLARDGRLHSAPQSDAGATYAAKIGRADALIDWSQQVAVLDRRIRALSPVPGALAGWRGSLVKVRAAVPLGASARDESGAPRAAGANGNDIARGHAPGTIIAVGREGIDVACGPETNPGVLRLIALQPAAGRTMSAHAFATGRGMAPGHSFEAGR